MTKNQIALIALLAVAGVITAAPQGQTLPKPQAPLNADAQLATSSVQHRPARHATAGNYVRSAVNGVTPQCAHQSVRIYDAGRRREQAAHGAHRLIRNGREPLGKRSRHRHFSASESLVMMVFRHGPEGEGFERPGNDL